MDLFKLVGDVIKMPLAIAKDVVTFGGVLIDEEEPETLKTLKKIDKDIFK
jgi:hypothetical protein